MEMVTPSGLEARSEVSRLVDETFDSPGQAPLGGRGHERCSTRRGHKCPWEAQARAREVEHQPLRAVVQTSPNRGPSKASPSR